MNALFTNPRYLKLISNIVAAVEIARKLTANGRNSIMISSLPKGTPTQVSTSYDANGSAPSYICTLDEWIMVKQYMNGTSGVYLIFNMSNPLDFYIGSSVNLGTRLNSYYLLTIGKHARRTNVERVFRDSGKPTNWGIIILGFYPPMVSLVMEQFFISFMKPTINRTLKVAINNLGKSTHISHVKQAVAIARELSVHFTHDPTAVIRLLNLAKGMTNAQDRHNLSDKPLTNLGIVIFVYCPETFQLIRVFNSLESCRRFYSSTAELLRHCIENRYIFRNEFILSTTVLTMEECKKFTNKEHVKGKHQIEVFDEKTGELLDTYPSIRDTRNRLFNGRRTTLNKAIKSGKAHKGRIFVRKPVPTQLPIYRYDETTGKQLLPVYNGVVRTIKGAHISQKNLRWALDTGLPYLGVFYTNTPR